tara:strand:+ start:94 stop:213 length:120 start_codon:yes stop_codon:yes gene_type:complete
MKDQTVGVMAGMAINLHWRACCVALVEPYTLFGLLSLFR